MDQNDMICIVVVAVISLIFILPAICGAYNIPVICPIAMAMLLPIITCCPCTGICAASSFLGGAASA